MNIVKADGVYSPLNSLRAILAAKESHILVRGYERMVLCGDPRKYPGEYGSHLGGSKAKTLRGLRPLRFFDLGTP